jgi:hypothetical protein
MRKTLTLAIILAAGCAPAGPPEPPRPVDEIAGRIAGPPQRCLRIDSTTSLRLTDSHRIIAGSGSLIWLNTAVCDGATNSDILVTYPIGSQYCRGDITRTIDRLSRIPGPGCVLGDFVPYRRP